jgi:hypothetical protein
MKKMQEKSKNTNIHDKAPTPSQTKPYGWQILISQLKRVATKTQDFSMAKDHSPPETKTNQANRQAQTKTSTPSEVENTKFYQKGLDKAQDKQRSLKHKAN